MPKKEWVETGIDLGTGMAFGVADQLVQNYDSKRESEQHEKLPVYKQWGSLLNFVVPALTVVSVAFGAVKDDMAIRATTIAGQLAGRKGTYDIANRNRVVSYTVWDVGNGLKKAVQGAGAPADESDLTFRM